MATRLQLHEELCTILGTRNVYFQPPENFLMSFPCIRYSLDDIYTERADNLNYRAIRKYKVILIHDDPDNDIVDKLVNFKDCKMVTSPYISDSRYHYVYSLYY